VPVTSKPVARSGPQSVLCREPRLLQAGPDSRKRDRLHLLQNGAEGMGVEVL
jgi:hypothetical protein